MIKVRIVGFLYDNVEVSRRFNLVLSHEALREDIDGRLEVLAVEVEPSVYQLQS